MPAGAPGVTWYAYGSAGVRSAQLMLLLTIVGVTDAALETVVVAPATTTTAVTNSAMTPNN